MKFMLLAKSRSEFLKYLQRVYNYFVQVSEILETTFFNAEELHLKRLNVKSVYNPHNAIILRGNLKLATVKTTQPLETSSFLVKGI